MAVLAVLMYKAGSLAGAIAFLVGAGICLVIEVIYQLVTLHGIDRENVIIQVVKMGVLVFTLIASFIVSAIVPGNYGFMTHTTAIIFLGIYILAAFCEMASTVTSIHLLYELAD